eukprot:scpid58404/ scgid14638/ Nucleoside diphosphate-linked moiety X motif 19, mitochondrial
MIKFLPSRRWREASSLVIAARNAENVNGSDYSILLLQRGNTATFAKSHHVFPGGVLDASDSRSDWLDSFSRILKTDSVTSTMDVLKTTGCSNEVRAPPTFMRSRAYDEDVQPFGLPAELAFKICSLRETFEESGILLARPATDTDFKHRLLDSRGGQPAEMASVVKLSESDRAHWASVVRADASKFLPMCQALDCVPDVWSTHLWSVWLTPSNAPKRFDTPFFLTVLPEVPDLLVNDAEHQSVRWLRASDIPASIAAGEVKVGPPQAMELLRIARHGECSELLQHAAQRAQEHGSERWCPLRVRCTDGLISVFPGDSLYGNFSSGESVDCTMLELISRSQRVHALLCYSSTDYRFYCNIPERRGHLFPVTHDVCPTPVADAV